MKRPLLWIGAIALFGVFAVVASLVGTYNSLVASSQQVDAAWSQVQNAYQRRADLVPNLVATVKGAAAHERETLEAVTNARARVGQVQLSADDLGDPKQVAAFQAAQGELSSALSRLLVVTESYPTLRANENFVALQSQLEGTENRIAVERGRYGEAARAFNTQRDSFPTVLVVGFFGDRFAKRAYFEAAASAQSAPQVVF